LSQSSCPWTGKTGAGRPRFQGAAHRVTASGKFLRARRNPGGTEVDALCGRRGSVVRDTHFRARARRGPRLAAPDYAP